MELDPGSIEGDDSFDSGDPETCATGTMCYDLVSLQLVLSDHLILAFQQGHQASPPLVKLKDSITSALGNTYQSLLPMVPIHLDHTFTQYHDLHWHMTLNDHFQPCYAFKQQAFGHQ
jgi:hypothetical protein